MNSPPTNFIQLEILVTALCVVTCMYCLGRPSDELALHVALYGRLGGEYSWVLHTSASHDNYNCPCVTEDTKNRCIDESLTYTDALKASLFNLLWELKSEVGCC